MKAWKCNFRATEMSLEIIFEFISEIVSAVQFQVYELWIQIQAKCAWIRIQIESGFAHHRSGFGAALFSSWLPTLIAWWQQLYHSLLSDQRLYALALRSTCLMSLQLLRLDWLRDLCDTVLISAHLLGPLGVHQVTVVLPGSSEPGLAPTPNHHQLQHNNWLMPYIIPHSHVFLFLSTVQIARWASLSVCLSLDPIQTTYVRLQIRIQGFFELDSDSNLKVMHVTCANRNLGWLTGNIK